MADATGLAEAMHGLPGFRVLGLDEGEAEVVILIETVARLEPCLGCCVVATAHDRIMATPTSGTPTSSPGSASWRLES
jgi:hypothetical protein